MVWPTSNSLCTSDKNLQQKSQKSKKKQTYDFFGKKKKKNTTILVLLFKEISLYQEMASPPVSGSRGLAWASRRTEGRKSLCLILDSENINPIIIFSELYKPCWNNQSCPWICCYSGCKISLKFINFSSHIACYFMQVWMTDDFFY